MTVENKLLQLIEDTDDIEEVMDYQIELMNHYLKTNQLDKRHEVFIEYMQLLEEIESIKEVI